MPYQFFEEVELENNQWSLLSLACFLCTDELILIFQDLETKSIVDELKPEVISMSSSKDKGANCISLAWSADGQTLFAGYTDNVIRVWQVTRNA